MKTYTIKEAAKLLNVTDRAVQRRCARHGIEKKNNRYNITLPVLIEWGYKPNNVLEHKPNTREHLNLQAGEVIEQEDGSIIECFTKENYSHLEQALIERNELKIELREMQKRLEQLQQWKEDFMRYTSQRNTIEAHEKGVIASTIEDIEEVQSEEILQKHLSDKRKMVLKDKAKFSDWLSSL